MSVSSIIPTYRPTADRINRCLECIIPQVEEVIICGDLQTEWPMRNVALSPKVRFIRYPTLPAGFGRQATHAANISSGEIIHFLNDDCYVGKDVIPKCLEAMTEGVGIVTHTLRFPSGLIQYAGKVRRNGSQIFHHEDFRRKHSRHTANIEQESACGASMLIRRVAFFNAGGFDPMYEAFCEDDDLAMQVRRNGWKVVFTPSCEGIHETHATFKTIHDWMKIVSKSNYRFAEKWRWYFRKNANVNGIGTF